MKVPNCTCTIEMIEQKKLCHLCEMTEKIFKTFDQEVFSDEDEKWWFIANACLVFLIAKFERDEVKGNISLDDFRELEEMFGQIWAKNFWLTLLKAQRSAED